MNCKCCKKEKNEKKIRKEMGKRKLAHTMKQKKSQTDEHTCWPKKWIRNENISLKEKLKKVGLYRLLKLKKFEKMLHM